MTREEWDACAAVAATYFPHTFVITHAAMLDVWFQDLEDLDGRRVEAAIRTMARNKEPFPSVGRIRELAGPDEPQASDLFGEVIAKAHDALMPPFRAGAFRPVEWSDPMIPMAIERIGGLRAFVESPASDLPSWRARFAEAFEDLKAQRRKHETFTARGLSPSLPVPASSPKVIGPVQLGDVAPAIGRPVPDGGKT